MREDEELAAELAQKAEDSWRRERLDEVEKKRREMEKAKGKKRKVDERSVKKRREVSNRLSVGKTY